MAIEGLTVHHPSEPINIVEIGKKKWTRNEQVISAIDRLNPHHLLLHQSAITCKW